MKARLWCWKKRETLQQECENAIWAWILSYNSLRSSVNAVVGPCKSCKWPIRDPFHPTLFIQGCGLCSSRLRLSLDRDWIRYHSLSTLAVLQPQVYWQCPSSFCYFDWSEFVQRGIVGIPASWTFPNGKGHQLSLAFQASLRALHRSLISYVPGRAPKFRSLAIFSP